MHTFRTVSITLTLLVTLGFMSTEALAKRPSDGDSSSSTLTESTLSSRSIRDLARNHLVAFQAVDPYITYRDLVSYIKNLNASSVAEAETALLAYLISLQGSVTNHEPSIEGTPAVNVNEGEAYEFIPTASDPDGDTLSFSAYNLPPWINLESTTGTLTGVPTEQDVGSYPEITILVTDGSATVSLAPFTLIVEPALDPVSASTTLSWSAPSTRSDGTALAMSEIDGYRIYMGETASSLLLFTDINDSSMTSYTFTNLSAGDYFFAVTSYDVDGNESAFSNIVNKSAL